MSQGKQPEKNILKVSTKVWYMMLSFIVVLFLVKLIQIYYFNKSTKKVNNIKIKIP
nr:MAG TPA: hypothetical protein [Caudoviricetes sp.]